MYDLCPECVKESVNNLFLQEEIRKQRTLLANAQAQADKEKISKEVQNLIHRYQ